MAANYSSEVDNNKVLNNLVSTDKIILSSLNALIPFKNISSKGAVITIDNDYIFYTYTEETGTFSSLNFIPNIKVLIVGGGGGGGSGRKGQWEGSGGGGAGGLGHGSLNIVANAIYNIKVGNGGSEGDSGEPSKISSPGIIPEIANGGGNGGGPGSSDGSDGGSGGGGNGDQKGHPGGNANPGSGTLKYLGNDGGFGGHAAGGAGGGGAKSKGEDNKGDSRKWEGTDGGDGFKWHINNKMYAAGGGGGSGNKNGPGGQGGNGIGGNGGAFNNNKGLDGTKAKPNTGSGGGGGAAYNGKGGSGSNGIVIFAVPLNLIN